MLKVGLFNLVKLLLVWVVCLEGFFIEEVAIIWCLLDDFESEFESCELELNDKVDEYLIAVFGYAETLANLPELLGDPSSDASDLFEVLHEMGDVLHLGSKHP